MFSRSPPCAVLPCTALSTLLSTTTQTHPLTLLTATWEGLCRPRSAQQGRPPSRCPSKLPHVSQQATARATWTPARLYVRVWGTNPRPVERSRWREEDAEVCHVDKAHDCPALSARVAPTTGHYLQQNRGGRGRGWRKEWPTRTASSSVCLSSALILWLKKSPCPGIS